MTAGPPTWSVTDLHPGLDSPTFLADFERLMSYGDSLAELFDHHDIRSIPSSASGDDTPSDIGGASVAANEVIAALNEANDLGRTLWAFVYAHIRSDSTDDVAQGFAARIGALIGRNRGLNARLAAWLAAVGVDRLATTSTAVAEHIGPLSRLAARAAHQMSEPEENLAAELSTTGSMAWTQLHAAVTSQLTVEVELPDGPRRMSIGEARSLATHPLEAVRKEQPGYEIAVTGLPAIAARNSAKLIGEMNWGLVGDMFVIFFFLAIVLRSALAGVASILPSLFPIFSTGALLWAVLMAFLSLLPAVGAGGRAGTWLPPRRRSSSSPRSSRRSPRPPF